MTAEAEPQFIVSADGTRLRVLRFGPAAPAAGRDLLIVHGLAEHAERYSHVAAAFVARGWRVSVLELRGHGHSGGKRGHVQRWQDYVDDVNAAVPLMAADYAMLAHSMGGLVTLESLRLGLHPRRVALSNPLLGVRVQAPVLKETAARGLSYVWPSLSLTNELDPAMLSRDPAVGAAYAVDPLVYNTITPRWYTEMRAAIQRVVAATYSVPIRFHLSETDPVTDPPVARELASRGTTMDVREYPGMVHEILNEIGKEAVIADIAEWLEAE
jgi:alpha-beta hydrolase superfamily lysophospholipase